MRAGREVESDIVLARLERLCLPVNEQVLDFRGGGQTHRKQALSARPNAHRQVRFEQSHARSQRKGGAVNRYRPPSGRLRLSNGQR